MVGVFLLILGIVLIIIVGTYLDWVVSTGHKVITELDKAGKTLGVRNIDDEARPIITNAQKSTLNAMYFATIAMVGFVAALAAIALRRE